MYYTEERLISSPKAAAVSPSDSVNLPFDARGIYVGVAGNVVVVFPDDSTVTFSGVPAGSILPVVAKRVNLSGTTAASLVALF